MLESRKFNDIDQDQACDRYDTWIFSHVYSWHVWNWTTELLSNRSNLDTIIANRLLSIYVAVLDSSSSDLSLIFQLPQNICMGLSEVFGTVASLEFAFRAAPRSGQSLFMSLQFCSLGLSSFLGIGYLSIYPTASNKFDFSVRWNTSLQLTFIISSINLSSAWLTINGHLLRTSSFLQHSN
jgi:hypothetical protein